VNAAVFYFILVLFLSCLRLPLAAATVLLSTSPLLMPPAKVLSFMSQWGGTTHLQKQPPSNTASPAPASPAPQSPSTMQPSSAAYAQSATALDTYNSERASPTPHQRNFSESRPSSRPISMIQTYQPPVMDIGADTLPELHRIFTFLNSHSNKLYQEGYFLKFHDTDTRTSRY
jgi:CCR4-NOT transcriptional complex subunit CAF120